MNEVVFIASDHAGFSLKTKVIENAQNLGVTFIDLGTNSEASVDYPDYAKTLATKLIEKGTRENNTENFGILICGSGVGVSIAVNRYPEIRAVLAESVEVAKLAREHNHANVLCIGSRIVSETKALDIIKTFLSATEDQGERHVNRVQKLSQK